MKDGASFSRKKVEALVDFVKKRGLGGLLWMKVTDNGVTGPGTKHIEDAVKHAIIEKAGAKAGDLILAAAAPLKKARAAMGALREEVAGILGLAKPRGLAFRLDS